MAVIARNLLRKKFCIIDVEYISLDKSRLDLLKGPRSNIHMCWRQVGYVTYSGVRGLVDIAPCLHFNELSGSEKRSFFYCKKNIHHLQYRPKNPNYFGCVHVKKALKDFLERHEIEILLYKGGSVEFEYSNKVCLASFNLENIGIPKIVKFPTLCIFYLPS